MKVEVLYAATDGTHLTHTYEAPKTSIQVWGDGRCKVTLKDAGGETTGVAQYTNAVYVRQGSCLPEPADG